MNTIVVLLIGLRLLAQQLPFPQQPVVPLPTVKASEQLVEDDDLKTAMGETNGAAIEVVRVLEAHLKKYPESSKRGELNRAIAKSAIELKDDRRIIEYGEKVLAAEPNDLQMLDRVTASLLGPTTLGQATTPLRAERALVYAKRFEQVVQGIEKDPTEKPDTKRKEDISRGLSRAWQFQARALGLTGKAEDAVVLARKSYERYPTETSAHELGRWLAASGHQQEAAEAFANAFSIPDGRASDTDRADDRKKAGESWKKAKGTEAGLGDLFLTAYDKTSAMIAERNQRLREVDPNRDVTNPFEYTISNLSGERLKLSQFKGSVVILDFWATWCGPCRAQYPLYEQVKEQFKDRKDVVFLAMNADEDKSLVKPFLEQSHWNKNVYFEDGLGRLLNVANIPATVVFDKQGQIASRMNGFLPDRFVDMLSSRIRAILAESESR